MEIKPDDLQAEWVVEWLRYGGCRTSEVVKAYTASGKWVWSWGVFRAKH